MKNKINLAMRCNQEQWELLKPKLENKISFNTVFTDFEKKYPYLTNFYGNEDGGLGWRSKSLITKEIIYEEFNEKIFLEACGISVIPTIEEVKKYFKYAETVECLSDGDTYEINLSKCIEKFNDRIYIYTDSKKSDSCCLFSDEKGYAKILTYKNTQPKFQISKETVIKYQMKDEFPEVFSTGLVVGKWYKGNVGFESLICIREVEKRVGYNKIHYYGFSSAFYREKDYIAHTLHERNLTEATTEEVTEALKNEALKRYKVGQVISSFISGIQEIPCFEDFKLEDGIFEVNGAWLMKDGVWATIERDVKTIKEAEELLNCKIV